MPLMGPHKFGGITVYLPVLDADGAGPTVDQLSNVSVRNQIPTCLVDMEQERGVLLGPGKVDEVYRLPERMIPVRIVNSVGGISDTESLVGCKPAQGGCDGRLPRLYRDGLL